MALGSILGGLAKGAGGAVGAALSKGRNTPRPMDEVPRSSPGLGGGGNRPAADVDARDAAAKARDGRSLGAKLGRAILHRPTPAEARGRLATTGRAAASAGRGAAHGVSSLMSRIMGRSTQRRAAGRSSTR